MKNGIMIIGIFAIVWACILTYITFFSNNPYLNTFALFFGMMITVCGFACGCEEIEKSKDNK